jgi:hypothetical protein
VINIRRGKENAPNTVIAHFRGREYHMFNVLTGNVVMNRGKKKKPSMTSSFISHSATEMK